MYFSTVGGKGIVEYKATLHTLLIEPRAGDPETEELLRFELPETEGEGLWGEYGSNVHTLYVVTNCHLVDQTFPLTELIKVSDDEPISADYSYGYV